MKKLTLLLLAMLTLLTACSLVEKPTPTKRPPPSSADRTRWASEPLPNKSVDYACFPGDAEFSHIDPLIGRYRKVLEKAVAGQLDQNQVEEQFVAIAAETQESIFKCLAQEVQVWDEQSKRYVTFDDFAERNFDMPRDVSVTDVVQVRLIQEQANRGEITQKEANANLEAMAHKMSKDGLTWLVRRMPVYDPDNGRWMTMDDYFKEMGQEFGVDPDTRLGQDPIGTSVDLLFGDYTTDEMIDWMGFDQIAP